LSPIFCVLAATPILLANPKMSDKIPFVVAFDSGRVAETSDMLIVYE
jgi:hypothetical protein